VSALLDVEDPISVHYTLVVSSPGVDRPLFTAAQCARFLGEEAKIVLKLPQDGRRRFQGRIAAVDGDCVEFSIKARPENAILSVTFDNIEKARLVPDWAALGYAPTKPGKKPAGRKPDAKRSDGNA
jgi:ribosome maturation factor RimP